MKTAKNDRFSDSSNFAPLPRPHFEDNWFFNFPMISYLSNSDWQKFVWFWLILSRVILKNL